MSIKGMTSAQTNLIQFHLHFSHTHTHPSPQKWHPSLYTTFIFYLPSFLLKSSVAWIFHSICLFSSFASLARVKLTEKLIENETFYACSVLFLNFFKKGSSIPCKVLEISKLLNLASLTIKTRQVYKLFLNLRNHLLCY